MFASVFNKKTEEENMGKAKRLRKELEEADAIVIGAGAGLSASAGFIYTGERFRKYFSDTLAFCASSNTVSRGISISLSLSLPAKSSTSSSL